MELFEKRRCNVCHSEDFEEIHREPIRTLVGLGRIDYPNRIVICRHCGMVFKNPLPTESELLYYYKHYSIHELFGYNAQRMTELYESLQGYFPPGFLGRVLEIGCANAHLLKVFRDHGWTVSGIDPNPASQKVAKEQHGLEILQGEFDKALFVGEAPFDLIVLYDVIEHLFAPEKLISDIGDLLAEEGLFYLVTPNVLKPYAELGYFSFEHLSYFSPQTLSLLMAKNGFESVAIDPAEKISSVWKKSSKAFEFRSDYPQVFAAVNEYKQKFDTRVALIRKRIADALAQVPAERLAVWGAGAHTGQLLAMTELGELSLHCFFDIDVKKQGMSLNGIPIKAVPAGSSSLREEIDGILISSKAFEDTIYKSIRYLEEQGVRIFTLYQP